MAVHRGDRRYVLRLLSLFFSVFAFPYLFKPAMALFLLLTSAAVYFINEYGVVIDSEMIRNIMHTNTGEAYDLLTGKLVLYVVGLGVLPALVLWLLPIAYRPFWQDLWFKTKATALVLPLIALIMLPLTGTAMSFFRENRILLRVMTPLNYLSAIVTYSRGSMGEGAIAAKPYGEDAHKASGVGGAREEDADRSCHWRDGPGAEFFIERLRAGNQSAAEQDTRAHKLYAGPLLRDGDGPVGAVHVFRPGPGRVSVRGRAGGPAAHPPARRDFRAVAGEPGRLCRCLQGRADGKRRTAATENCSSSENPWTKTCSPVWQKKSTQCRATQSSSCI